MSTLTQQQKADAFYEGMVDSRTNCDSCGRPIMWIATRRDRKVALEIAKAAGPGTGQHTIDLDDTGKLVATYVDRFDQSRGVVGYRTHFPDRCAEDQKSDGGFKTRGNPNGTKVARLNRNCSICGQPGADASNGVTVFHDDCAPETPGGDQ